MAIDPTAFERFRRSPNEKTTLFRLTVGTIIVVVCWFGTTFAILIATPLQQWFEAEGVFAMLATFSGIWAGLWIAMRFLHRESLSSLFGNSGRISRSGFFKGFVAVVLASLLTEFAYQAVIPGIARSTMQLSTWLLLLLPLTFFAFVQTSSEELLFRGYLMRGLASRFRNPLIWMVLPTVVFTALHLNPQSPNAMNVVVLVTIGAFSALLAFLVYATGNLGAAMGVHLGNNLFGFAVISHDQALGGLSLFQAPSLENIAWTPASTALICGISIISILFLWLLLLHRRSPLAVARNEIE